MDLNPTTPTARRTATLNMRRRIAVVTMGVKLGDEVRGYTRFRFLSELLAANGFDVDLITSDFQHWDKSHRDITRPCYHNLPYTVRFIHENGYKRNLDPARILSHAAAAKNLRELLESLYANGRGYDLIYVEIPPNDVARVCGEVAHAHGVPFVVDINDLWPEAMRMALNIPVVSDIAFYPFARDAKHVYRMATAAVGTSDEYALRPAKDRTDPLEHITVYVGNDLSAFDAGVREHAADVVKPESEFWVIYTGTLGASYDLATLIEAAALYDGFAEEAQPASLPRLRVKILGDGPERENLEALATQSDAPVDFLGYTPYPLMAAYLAASDVTVNSLKSDAPQSIVTKIGDYLAAGKPMINTGASPEFRAKVEADGFGVNIDAEDAAVLAGAMAALAQNPSRCATMGAAGRAIAEEQFDQAKSYMAIVDLIRDLLKKSEATRPHATQERS